MSQQAPTRACPDCGGPLPAGHARCTSCKRKAGPMTPLTASDILHLIIRYPCGCDLCTARQHAKKDRSQP